MPTISAAKMAMNHVKNVVSSKINAGTAATGIVEGLGAMKQSNSKRLILNQIKLNNVF